MALLEISAILHVTSHSQLRVVFGFFRKLHVVVDVDSRSEDPVAETSNLGNVQPRNACSKVTFTGLRSASRLSTKTSDPHAATDFNVNRTSDRGLTSLLIHPSR
jgi:hypothetical protein